jgi:RES domain-containing protein
MSTPAQRIRLPPGMTLDDVPVRQENGRWWRQTAPRYTAVELPHCAKSGGRCHRRHQQPRLYASSTETAAWGELFRHLYGEVSPFEMRRNMSEIEITELPVVDLEDPYVRALFSVSEASLVSNSYAACRKITDLLRKRPDRFGGMILPSAAVPGERTLVVFAEWIPDHVNVIDADTDATPIRLLPLFRAVAETLPRPLRRLARAFIRDLERQVIARAERELQRRHQR